MQLRPPSFALVVAALALTLSAGGVGYAAGTIKTADLANNAVTSPKVKNGTLKTNDLSKSAIAALQGATGPAGPAGTPGTPGSPGAPGTARAYAFVSVIPNLAFQTGYESGFTSVSRASTGIYCLTPDPGVSIAGRIPTFSNLSNISASQPRVYWSFQPSSCDAGDLQVQTYSGNTTLSDTVAFGVVIS